MRVIANFPATICSPSKPEPRTQVGLICANSRPEFPHSLLATAFWRPWGLALSVPFPETVGDNCGGAFAGLGCLDWVGLGPAACRNSARGWNPHFA